MKKFKVTFYVKGQRYETLVDAPDEHKARALVQLQHPSASYITLHEAK